MMNKKHIYIWWDPSQENGSFSLLLAHLISTSEEWEDSEIHLKSIVLEENVEETRLLLQELVTKSRIEASIAVYFPDPELIENLEQRTAMVDNFISSTGVLKIKEVFKHAFGSGPKEIEEAIIQTDAENVVHATEAADKEEIDQEEAEIDREEATLKKKLSDQVDLSDEKLLAKTIKNIIIKESENADLVLLGFNLPKQGGESAYIRRMNDLLEEMPTTLLINCPFDVDLFG